MPDPHADAGLDAGNDAALRARISLTSSMGKRAPMLVGKTFCVCSAMEHYRAVRGCRYISCLADTSSPSVTMLPGRFTTM